MKPARPQTPKGGMQPAPTFICPECLGPLMVSASGRLVCPNE
jgi:hypothetical protein